MNEFQEFPKALYHPKTGDMVTVRNAEQEAEQLEAWGASAPKLELKSAPAGNDGEGAPKAAPKPKATRTAKPKAN